MNYRIKERERKKDKSVNHNLSGNSESKYCSDGAHFRLSRQDLSRATQSANFCAWIGLWTLDLIWPTESGATEQREAEITPRLWEKFCSRSLVSPNWFLNAFQEGDSSSYMTGRKVLWKYYEAKYCKISCQQRIF